MSHLVQFRGYNSSAVQLRISEAQHFITSKSHLTPLTFLQSICTHDKLSNGQILNTWALPFKSLGLVGYHVSYAQKCSEIQQ